eukprot:scaffold738_cov124-Cylindrotheca_fusiformis.AAC.6
MLSLRQLVAQQSQDSIKQENDGFTGRTTSSGLADAPRKSTKRKAEPSSRKPAAKRGKHEDASDSSSGEEWFGDDDTENNWQGDYQEFGKSYTESLGAIYKTASVVPTPTSLGSSNVALYPMQKKSVKFRSRTDKLQPRTRELRRNGTTELITETPKEAERRVLKDERNRERERMVNRWKRRAINYTLEEDIGNSFQARAKRLLEDAYRSEHRQQLRAQSEKQRDKTTLKSEKQDDDSEIEQGMLLERLTQNSVGDETKQESATREAPRDPSIPFKDQMDFWEYGKAYPDNQDLEKYKYKDLSSFNLVGKKVQVKKKKQTTAEKKKAMQQMVPFSTFIHGLRKKLQEEQYQPTYFLSTTRGNSASMDRFSYLRHLRTIAIRQLCSQLCDQGTETRLIRCLLTNARHASRVGPVASFDTSASSQIIAYQLAKNLLFYYEHSWTDPNKVAQHLGLADKLAGCTIPPHRVVEFFKLRRSFVRQHYLKKKRDWAHEGNYEELGDGDIPDASSASLHDEASKIPDDPPTSDGVVFEKFSEMGSSIKGLAMERVTQRAMVTPTSVFAHVPGTNPPIPDFPMDALGIIFGPVDRHAKFHHAFKLDDTTFRLILSTLVARVAKEQGTGVTGSSESKTNRVLLKELLEDFLRLHNSKSSVFYERAYRMDGVSKVGLYRALMSYCSLIASRCPLETTFQTTIKEDPAAADDDDSDDLYSDIPADDDDVRPVAKDIVNLLEEYVDRSELMAFPRLPVMYALAQLASGVPRSASEILSKPVDGHAIRTPLDIFQQTLEHMERKDMIVSRTEYADEDDTVDIGNLEYMFFNASQVLQQCVKVDSLNVDYHLWYIGALGSCLLLCSGNRIGSGARGFPSERKDERWGFDSDCAPHEVRQKLPKFDEMRLGLATAVKLLIELANHQEGARAYLAISSFLDWSEVVALLVGDSLPEELENLKQFHNYHAMRWILLERPSQAEAALFGRNDGSALSWLAAELENKPGNIDTWRAFVRKLGPLVGCRNRNTTDHDCSTCPKCQWLRRPGGEQQQHQLNSSSWWGADRGWWVTSVLQMRRLIKRRWKPFTEPVMQALEANLPDLQSPPPLTLGKTWSDTRKEDLTTEWLPTSTTTRHDAPKRSRKERSQTFDSQLPQSLMPSSSGRSIDGVLQQESLQDKSDDIDIDDNDDESITLPKLKGPSSEQVEVECYKLLIFAHMSEDLTQVELYLHNLIFNCGAKEGFQQECDAFYGLQWLCSMGLNVPKLTRAFCSNYRKSKCN